MAETSVEEVSTSAELCQLLADATQDEYILAALNYILPPGACMRRDEAFAKIAELAKACDVGVNVSSLKTRFSAVVNKFEEVFPADIWKVCRLGAENVHVYLFSVVQELKRLSADGLCGNIEIFNRAFDLAANCFSAALRYYGEFRFVKLCVLSSDALAARLEDLATFVERFLLPAAAKRGGAEVTPYHFTGLAVQFVIDDTVESDALIDSMYKIMRKIFSNERDAVYAAILFLTGHVKKKGDLHRELCAKEKKAPNQTERKVELRGVGKTSEKRH